CRVRAFLRARRETGTDAISVDSGITLDQSPPSAEVRQAARARGRPAVGPSPRAVHARAPSWFDAPAIILYLPNPSTCQTICTGGVRGGGRAGGGTHGFSSHQATPALRLQRGRRSQARGAPARRGHRRLLDGEPRRPDAAARRREPRRIRAEAAEPPLLRVARHLQAAGRYLRLVQEALRRRPRP